MGLYKNQQKQAARLLLLSCLFLFAFNIYLGFGLYWNWDLYLLILVGYTFILLICTGLFLCIHKLFYLLLAITICEIIYTSFLISLRIYHVRLLEIILYGFQNGFLIYHIISSIYYKMTRDLSKTYTRINNVSDYLSDCHFCKNICNDAIKLNCYHHICNKCYNSNVKDKNIKCPVCEKVVFF